MLHGQLAALSSAIKWAAHRPPKALRVLQIEERLPCQKTPKPRPAEVVTPPAKAVIESFIRGADVSEALHKNRLDRWALQGALNARNKKPPKAGR